MDTTIASLHAITPIDGRYHQITQTLSKYFSEAAYIKYRFNIEVSYFNDLKNILHIDCPIFTYNLTDNDILVIKQHEKILNHDVKAIEYFLKSLMQNTVHQPYLNFIHFGLTSQDINNPAITLMLYDFLHETYIPTLENIIKELQDFASNTHNIKLLAHTHGQPATPTNLSHEILVFVERLSDELHNLTKIQFKTKCGGAVGTLSAHKVAYPEINWPNFMDEFIKNMRDSPCVVRQQYTTQIENYDSKAQIFDNLKRINNILIDASKDFWLYISMNYLKLRIISNEVGSSTMPHKINPIDFENAEGNFLLANSILEFMSSKLPLSRLQRDLTDSTILRNIGTPLSQTIIALNNFSKGLSKVTPNITKINKDLEDNYCVVGEAIQTILRREGVKDPYELLKKISRDSPLTKEAVDELLTTLNISVDVKNSILAITPFNL